MNQPIKFTPLTPDDMTKAHIDEALALATRYDRNLASRENGPDAFPVPVRTARLMALVILHLHKKLEGTKVGKAIVQQPARQVGKSAAIEQAKGVAKKAGVKVKDLSVAEKPQSEQGPPLSEEQLKAFNIIKDLKAKKQVITSRKVAEAGEWKSHNTGARHIKNLKDLGYLKQVGKQKVIALTGLEP